MLRLTNNPANANSASSVGVNRNNTNYILQDALNVNNGGTKRMSNNVNTILINRRTGAAINTAEKPHVNTHVDPNTNINANNKEEKIITENSNNFSTTTSRKDNSRNTNTSSVYSSLRKDRSYAEVNDNVQGALTSVNGNVTNTVFMSNGAKDNNGVLANADDNNIDYVNNNNYYNNSRCQIHDGILGCIKRRILCEMIDSIAGMYKILICDNIAAQIISSVVRMHDLLDHGVTLVEDLFLTRQPIISSPALYLLCPDEASIRQVLQDWQCKSPYKSAHIFFIGRTPDRLIQQLASVPRLVSNTQTLKDLFIDFTVPESLLFHLNFPLDYNKLFPPTIGLSTLTTLTNSNSNNNNMIALQIATRLMSVLHTMNCGVPLVRYQASSVLAHSVARSLLDELARMAKDESTFQLFAHNPDRPLLLIVDRSFDPVAPLVHERSYQCLLDDLMPLVNNIYEQIYVGRKGEQGTRTSVLDENDMYWCQYRHKFFAICLDEFAKLMQELLRSNPSLAQGMQQSMNNTNNNSKRLEELGSAIRALPEFQERQAKLSMHIDICSKIMQKYSSQRLAEVCEIEQDIAASRKTFKENYENVRRLVSDETLTSNVRLRLLLILFTVCDSRKIHELSQVKRLELIDEGKLASEVEKMSNLPRFIPQSGMLKYRESEMIGRSSPDSYANRSTSSSTRRHDRNKFSTTSTDDNNDGNINNNNNESAVKSDKKFTIKSLRRGIDLTSSAKNSINNVISHNTGNLDDTKSNMDTLNNKNKRTNANNNDGIDNNEDDDDGKNKRGTRQRDPFRNQAYLIFNAACHNILSSSDFPTLNEAMCENDTNARNATGKRTLRMGLARLHDIAGKRSATNKTNNFYSSGNNNNDNDNDNDNTIIKMSSSSTANTNTSEFSSNHHATLDLHHEGRYSLTATPKIILFVIGGVTYGETRAAYEIAKKNGRECIIGSTSLLRPESFVAQLQALH